MILKTILLYLPKLSGHHTTNFLVLDNDLLNSVHIPFKLITKVPSQSYLIGSLLNQITEKFFCISQLTQETIDITIHTHI